MSRSTRPTLIPLLTLTNIVIRSYRNIYMAQGLPILLKTEAKKVLNASGFSSSLLIRLQSLTSIGPVFALELLLLSMHFMHWLHLMPFLLSEITLVIFNSDSALALSLLTQTTTIHSSCKAWPFFQRSHNHFLLLSLMSSAKVVFGSTCLIYSTQELPVPLLPKGGS